MIIVTHEMQFARAVADRIIFLEGGKIQEDETPDEFFEHPKTDRAKKFLNTFTFESVKRDIESICNGKFLEKARLIRVLI